jgi:thiol:disulfide interchange protein
MAHRCIALVVVAATACQQPPAWSPDEAQAFERARQEHNGVMVEFYAGWSLPAVHLDEQLRSGRIASALAKSFVPVKIDVSDETDGTALILQRYQVATLPTVVFVSSTGSVLERIASLPDDDELPAIIERAAQRSSRAM